MPTVRVGSNPIEFDGVTIVKLDAVPQGTQVLCNNEGYPRAMCNIGDQIPGKQYPLIILNPIDYEIALVSYKKTKLHERKPTVDHIRTLRHF